MSRDTNGRAGYDIIGDIHGCAEPLEGLLEALGYEVVDGCSEYAAVDVGEASGR